MKSAPPLILDYLERKKEKAMRLNRDNTGLYWRTGLKF